MEALVSPTLSPRDFLAAGDRRHADEQYAAKRAADLLLNPPNASECIKREDAARQGKPDVVYLACEIVHLWDLDVKTESFSCELIVYTRWRCPADETEEAILGSNGGLDETWAPDWFPRIKVWNICGEFTERERRFSATRDAADHSLVWIQGLTTINCKITEVYDLLAFPFDMQDLTIRLEVDNTSRVAPYPVDALNAIERRWREVALVLPKGVSHLPDFAINTDVPASFKLVRNELIIVLVRKWMQPGPSRRSIAG
jgi:hypothetical protein